MESCVLIPGHGHGVAAASGIYRGNLAYDSNPNPNPNPDPNPNPNPNPDPNPDPNPNQVTSSTARPQASRWAVTPTRGITSSSRCVIWVRDMGKNLDYTDEDASFGVWSTSSVVVVGNRHCP
eukprot:scaffold126080_cov40-Phaeocystis_antarctica.AAC.1